MNKKQIISAIIVIFVIALAVTIRNGLLWEKEELTLDHKIGKEIYITIADNEIVDAEYLSMVAEGTENSVIGLWDSGALTRLIEYMEKNDYVIKPGKYIINQAWSFDEVKEVFKFIKR